MLDKLKQMFRIGPAIDFSDLVRAGALILDVRTRSEFSGGHIKGAINIPVQELAANLGKMPDRKKTIIVCCASGMRSASARDILISHGYSNVFNGGGWRSLAGKLGNRKMPAVGGWHFRFGLG